MENPSLTVSTTGLLLTLQSWNITDVCSQGAQWLESQTQEIPMAELHGHKAQSLHPRGEDEGLQSSDSHRCEMTEREAISRDQ